MHRWMEALILCPKNLQNRLYRGTLKYSIFLRNLCGHPILIFFSHVGLKVRRVENSDFYPPVFLDFSVALEARW